MQRVVLPVNEIFESVQGEAEHAGEPSVFVRLQGCPVGCAWCDTKHTWNTDERQVIDIARLTAKTADPSPTYANMSVDEVVTEVVAHTSRHVVLTGGEPCMYDLTDLCDTLFACGRSVQIETSGTFPIRAPAEAWVTLSPKIKKPGGFPVLSMAWSRANEIKLPVAIERDITTFDAEIAAMQADDRERVLAKPVWLQPVFQSKHGMTLCIEAAADRGWRVSLQGHKAYGIR
jgi:7-carboxy-7-deazaguanine synthase